VIAQTLSLAFGWDPEVRGILVVGLAVIGLMGSTWLLLFTNLGARLGLLVAVAGFLGIMVIISGIWTMYGSGPRGADPTWRPQEIIIGDISNASLPEAQDLSTWTPLATEDKSRGEAVTAATVVLLKTPTNPNGLFTTTDEFTFQEAYQTGGERYFFYLLGRPNYLVVKAQPTVDEVLVPGAPPPKATPDPTQPPVWVLMIRDQGNRRGPSALVLLYSTILFLVTCYALHRRDVRGQELRERDQAALKA